ncbi:hypothetical protein N0V82_003056 [Gnomoniopsis sp. IMI 355080]|nr:hypothetical protein N0V82_003056 [Gnomoniopsis sp. IMI 355080]
MKSLFGILLLATMALATLIAPLTNLSNGLAPLLGANTTSITKILIHRQIGPKTLGSSCSDEGAWFCMSNAFQRCASGEWSIVQECAPGTQCEPLGVTHNASQPAFGVYNGNSGTTKPDSSTTTFSIEPVTRTTTVIVNVPWSPSMSSSIVTSSVESGSTRTGIPITSPTSSLLSAGAPKADTSDGARTGETLWWVMGMMGWCLCYQTLAQLTVI